MSSLQSSLFSNFHAILDKIRARPVPVATAATLVFTVGIPAVRYVKADYSKWLALGRGGAPPNFFGYLLVQYLGSAGDSDVTSTTVYVQDAKDSKLEATSFLEPAGTLSTRPGPRPNISKWAAPVRQLSAMAPEDVKQKLFVALQHIASAPPSEAQTVARASDIEGATHANNALHISDAAGASDPARRSASRGPTELYHVHPSDGSAHCLVSAADAKLIIEAGWGERHPLSGARLGGFPATYVHVYAPRNLDEVKVHENVARAAVRYAAKK